MFWVFGSRYKKIFLFSQPIVTTFYVKFLFYCFSVCAILPHVSKFLVPRCMTWASKDPRVTIPLRPSTTYLFHRHFGRKQKCRPHLRWQMMASCACSCKMNTKNLLICFRWLIVKLFVGTVWMLKVRVVSGKIFFWYLFSIYSMFITCRGRNILRISRSKAVKAFLNHVIPKQNHYNQQNGNGNNNSNDGFPRGTLLLEKEW